MFSLRAPEAVLLALKGEVGHRYTLYAQSVDNHLGLIGRHHFVLESLEHNQRPCGAWTWVNGERWT
jgi:hypothetical protein